MKLLSYKLFLLASCMALASSCKKIFDVERPGGTITPEKQWSSPDFIKGYVNGFYGFLPNWNRSEEISAEAYSGGSGGITSSNNFLTGKYTSSSGYPDLVWDWGGVRSLNTFFANISSVKATVVESDFKSLAGQAYFFRAFLYYRMVKILGGVPIITDVQNPFADVNTLMVKRNTTLECFDFISKQLDSAILNLPVSWGPNDVGRITKGAAMAVKGEVLLLKASPLFCKTPNAGYWKDAFDALTAAKKELDADGYGLYTDNTAKPNENMWYNKAQAAKEMVLYVRFHYPERTNGFVAGQRPNSISSGAAGACDPTWEFVKEYPMNTGLDITDPASGYDSTVFWKNRDPRFYQAIVYNGARYDFADYSPRVQWLLTGIAGADEYGTLNRTGFYCRKGIDTTLGITTFGHQAFDWPIIRYAEVLLNLAESANEIGRVADARDYLIQIRRRANILPGTGNYGLSPLVGADYNATFNAIMKEKEIEFAFEGKRFWDLRRRRMLYVLNNMGTLHGYGPYLNAANASTMYGINTSQPGSAIGAQISALMLNQSAGFDPDAFLKNITSYKYEAIDKSATNRISIPEAYYFGMIDPQYIQQNKNLQQNIGWDNGTFNPVIQ
ncbi:putative outer membrane starch-binding protein [Chitinophaga polysaccharea]|uniref:Putative outer membrane starch-binding protein n=1 Tax=Chitinophaga polysaccharea TaxID=1293035 RepID=A0A561Q5T2_9BACT|nr:RagB/SusD family nutrient uptake outer membrane protein [Chitinophaga polysaccharea]TWF45718.1 putative outer membrane starch-binding protein [Chitinophaga polysaccharea]